MAFLYNWALDFALMLGYHPSVKNQKSANWGPGMFIIHATDKKGNNYVKFTATGSINFARAVNDIRRMTDDDAKHIYGKDASFYNNQLILPQKD